MQSRRDFLKTAGYAAGGAFVQSLPTKRREVSIGKRRIKVIDMHGHFIAPEELDVVKDTKLATNVTNNLNGQLFLGS